MVFLRQKRQAAEPLSQRGDFGRFGGENKPCQAVQQLYRTMLHNGCSFRSLAIGMSAQDQANLFAPPAAAPGAVAARPLADRLRPGSLDQISGQDHLVGPSGTLTRMLARGGLASLILWGPPGVGKTSIARLLAAASGLHFMQLSAVFSGVADLKRAFEEATKRRALGQATLLFVDEIHRFNRAQQDGFLPVVEDGTIVLVGATTENPSFALIGALLSRCQVLVLHRLGDAALEELLCRAETDLGAKLALTEEGRASLRAMADGDGRYLLNMVEQISTETPTAPLDAGPWPSCWPAARRCTTATERSISI